MSKSTLSGAVLVLGMFTLLALVVTAGASHAQNSNSGTTDNTNAGGSRNANAGNHNAGGHGSLRATRDSRFVMFAAMGGMAEVELGRLAAQKGASEDVRQFGQRMVDDHTKSNEELMSVVSPKGIRPPTTLDAKHQAAVRKLSALSGERFDREYARMMVGDHKKTVAEFQREADRGADPDIKAFAASKLPALQEHLRMAQRLDAKLALRRSGNLRNANDNADSNQ
jgi:putative membrane protein